MSIAYLSNTNYTMFHKDARSSSDTLATGKVQPLRGVVEGEGVRFGLGVVLMFEGSNWDRMGHLISCALLPCFRMTSEVTPVQNMSFCLAMVALKNIYKYRAVIL